MITLYGQDGEVIASGKGIKNANLGGFVFWFIEPAIAVPNGTETVVNPAFVAKATITREA